VEAEPTVDPVLIPLMQFLSFAAWFGCGIGAAVLGDKIGFGCLGALLGFLLGPIGLLIVFAMIADKEKCPACKKLVARNTTKCPWCQSDLPNSVQ
jgi:hypothetical protein